MFIKNIHVSLFSINLCLQKTAQEKVYLKTYLSNTPNTVDQIQIQIQIQIHGLKFDQIQIQIQIRRICICICICKYKYVFDPSPACRSGPVCGMHVFAGFVDKTFEYFRPAICRHRENFWAFARPRTDFCLILLILNMVIHRTFTGPTHLLSLVSFGVSEYAMAPCLAGCEIYTKCIYSSSIWHKAFDPTCRVPATTWQNPWQQKHSPAHCSNSQVRALDTALRSMVEDMKTIL